MIALLAGDLVERLADGAVVDVHGVGYRLYMPASVVVALPPAGRVRVFTHLHVREDALALYGFSTAEQRDLFAVLLGVNGIGPKGALAVLSIYSPHAFRRAVATEDLDALTLIPGVGKKTAARMVLELRERLALPDSDVVPGAHPSTRSALVEVKGALLSLGYSPVEARDAIEALEQRANGHASAGTEELLRLALKELARA